MAELIINDTTIIYKRHNKETKQICTLNLMNENNCQRFYPFKCRVAIFKAV